MIAGMLVIPPGADAAAAIAAQWPDEAIEFPPRGLGPAAEWIPSADAPPPPSVPSVEAHWLAKSCDHLGPTCANGCSGDKRICLAGRGAVTHSECMACCSTPGSPGGPILD